MSSGSIIRSTLRLRTVPDDRVEPAAHTLLHLVTTAQLQHIEVVVIVVVAVDVVVVVVIKKLLSLVASNVVLRVHLCTDHVHDGRILDELWQAAFDECD